MDLVAAFASVNASLELAKTLIGAQQAVDAATYKFQIADLTSNLATVKIALTEVQEEMSAKDREIDRLRLAFAKHGTLVEFGGFRFFADEDGQPEGFAVCPRCEVVDGRLIQVVRKQSQVGHVATCPECRRDYDGRESNARSYRRSSAG